MQQEMDPRQSQSNWEMPLYAHPEGSPKIDDRPYDSYDQGLSSQNRPHGSSRQQPGGFSSHSASKKASPSQRLALAIVSVVMLAATVIPIIFSSLPSASLIIVIGLICLTLVIINGIFNSMA